MSNSTGVAVERVDVDHSHDALQQALHRQRYDFALSRIASTDSVLEVGTGMGFFSEMVVDVVSNLQAWSTTKGLISHVQAP